MKYRGRKLAAALLLTMTAAVFAGCGAKSQDANRTSTTVGVAEVLESQAKAAEESAGESAAAAFAESIPQAPETEETKPAKTPDPNADIDLTILPGNMVYAEVFNMTQKPNDYMGKKIRVCGLMSTYHDEANDKYYFSCIVPDAAACCSSGIEFVLKEEYKYPDDYPPEGAIIQVLGEFDSYKDGEYRYYTLRNTDLVG